MEDMVKVCLACGTTTYIRIRVTGEVGIVCEGCQKEALDNAVEVGRGRGNNNLGNIKRGIDRWEL